MSITAIRTAIKAILDGVTGVENTFARQVWPKDEADFITKFQSADGTKFLGFEFDRVNYVPTLSAFNKKRFAITFELKGWYGIKDEDDSYITFEDLMVLITDTFNKNLTISGTVEDSEMAQLGIINEETQFGRLFHTGMISWTVYGSEIFSESIE